MATEIFRARVRRASDELIRIQTPIRILDAIKWGRSVEQQFLAGAQKHLDLPKDVYQHNQLGFNVAEVLKNLDELETKIQCDIGHADGLGPILLEVVENYKTAVEMLALRGQPEFGHLSRKLWGSAHEPFLAADLTLFEYAENFHRLLSSMDHRRFRALYQKTLSAAQVVDELERRFSSDQFLARIEVRESDGIVADAAAGGASLKIRPDAFFSQKDVDILEVHEAHTHIATSLNGRAQSYARWLGYGPPRSTATQEGLAILMESMTMSTYPQRIRKINDRVRAIGRAERGADAGQVFAFLRNEGYEEPEAYKMMMRIFRGTSGEGGAPFAKDLSYLKGFLECYNFVYASLAENASEHIHLLYSGKVKLEDVPVLMAHTRSGLIDPPQWLPPVFERLDELASWFIFPAQLGQLNDFDLQIKYRQQIRKYAGGG